MKKVLVLLFLFFPFYAGAQEKTVIIDNVDHVDITRTIVASGEYFEFKRSAVKSDDGRYTISDLTPKRQIVIETESDGSSAKKIVKWHMVELL